MKKARFHFDKTRFVVFQIVGIKSTDWNFAKFKVNAGFVDVSPSFSTGDRHEK
jgi:hypothetical protein